MIEIDRQSSDNYRVSFRHLLIHPEKLFKLLKLRVEFRVENYVHEFSILLVLRLGYTDKSVNPKGTFLSPMS